MHAMTLAALHAGGSELRLQKEGVRRRRESKYWEEDTERMRAKAQATLKTLRHVAFGGGGLKGFAHVGVWRTLLRHGDAESDEVAKQLETASGCSAGAFAALAIALGATPLTMAQWVKKLAQLETMNIVWARETEISVLGTSMLESITEKLVRTALLTDPCKERFKEVHGEALWEEVIKHPSVLTFAHVHALFGVSARIYVANLSRRVLEVWSHESHPDESVVWAVTASASAPGVFSPMVHAKTGQLYWDGGLYQHSPRLVAPDIDPSTVLLVHLTMPQDRYDDMISLLVQCRTDSCVAARTSPFTRWRMLTTVLVNTLVEGQYEAHDGRGAPKLEAPCISVAMSVSITNMMRGISSVSRTRIIHEGDRAAQEWLML